MLVDDHPIWRDTLRHLLEQGGEAVVVAEASDGTEVVTLALAEKPDVVLMDINLPSVDGIEATRRLAKDLPGTKVLVLASSDERAQVVEAIRSGASGYLLKTAAPTDVVEAVGRINRGELVFPPGLADVVLEELRRPSDTSHRKLRVQVVVPSVVERRGIVQVLEEAGMSVVASASTISQLSTKGGADLVVVDGSLLGGAEGPALPDLGAKLRESNVLVLSDDEEDIDGALPLFAETGKAVGYVLKRRVQTPGDLADAVKRVARGNSVLDSQVVDRLVDLPNNVRSLDELTEREREVLALMAEGHSNQAIAERMFLGIKTVEGHVRNIFMKLGLEPDADLHRRVVAVVAYLRSAR